MSVMVLSIMEYGQLADFYDLRRHSVGGGAQFFNYRDRCEQAYMRDAWGSKTVDDEDKRARSEICRFFDRVYIANQLAFLYSYEEWAYPDQTTIERLDEKAVINGHELTARKALGSLEGIRYNIFTNGGNCFLGREDHNRLDELINDLRGDLIRDLGYDND